MFDATPYQQWKETYQNNYQFKASAVVAEAVYRKGMGLEPGPKYISMPVGCGKTTGAVWGIVRFAKKNPDKKVCFLTPYVKGVKDQFEKLEAELGEANVGRFYSGASGGKLEQLKKQVFVCTHQFGSHNLDKLQDRDLVVVDEAFYGSDDVQITAGHAYEVWEWARREGILADEFRSVFDLLDGIGRGGHNGSDFVSVDPTSIGHDLSIIAKYDFSNIVNPFTDIERVGDIQSFCKAILYGQAFAHHKGDGKVVFASGALGIPSLKNVVVLTATGGMTYSKVGPFKEIPLVKKCFDSPTYRELSLVRLSGPELQGSYRSWRSAKTKHKVVEYVEWVLEQVTEDEIYFCVPKSVLDGCLTDFFGFGKGEVKEFPATVTRAGKTIHLSHHHVGIGSNIYKDCKAVVYLWDNHIPTLASVRKYHVLSGDEVTKASLADANNGYLGGDFAAIRDASLVESVVQQIGRGRIRQIKEGGQAGAMKAYVLLKPKTFSDLLLQMTDCQIVDCEGYGKLPRPSSRVQKILEYLQGNSGRDIPKGDIEKVTRTNINRVKEELEGLEDQLQSLGYRFQRGSRGKGNSAKFIWVGISKNDNYPILEGVA